MSLFITQTLIRRALTSLVTALILVASWLLAAPAHGTPATPDPTKAAVLTLPKGKLLTPTKTVRTGGDLAQRAFSAALTRAGSPYVYGASGPGAFDCSGLTMWAYAQAGKQLPHSSSAQAGMVTRTSSPEIGDLVFFTGSGGIYHVGLYAGGNQVFHASRPGTPVGRAPIWTSSVFFGRVR